MKTKYILVGGYPFKAQDGRKSFCEEIVQGFKEPVKILECLFARPQEVWEKSFNDDKEFFAKHLPDKIIEMRCADTEKFIDQVRWTDVVYLRGGNTLQLLNALKDCGEWQKELDGKTVAGTSAGAEVISKYHYNIDDLTLGEGFGMIPTKVIVHWQSDYNAPNIDWQKVYAELKNYKEDLPIITLAEGQFMVMNK